MADKSLKLAFILSATDKMSRVVDQAVKKSTSKLTAFERNATKVGSSMMKAGGIMTGVGVGIGAAAFGMAKSTAEYGDEVWKTSQKVGIGVESWQKLAYAAKYSGVEQEALASGMNKFNKVVVAAASGSRAQVELFEDMGISMKDAQGNLRSTDDLFKDLAGAFAKMPDGAAKSDMAMKLLGKSGAELIPLLNSGAGGLESMGAEAERMGFVMGEGAAKASEQFNDNFDRVKDSAKGLSMQFGTALIPMLDSLIVKVTDTVSKVSSWIKENPGLVSTISKIALGLSSFLIIIGTTTLAIGAITFVAGKFASVFRGVSTVVKVGTSVFKGMTMATVSADKATKAYAVGQKIAQAAQWLFNTSLLGCPILWIVAGIVTVIAAVWLLVKNWDKISAFFKKLWDGIKKIFSIAWEWLKTMFLDYTPHGLIIKHWDSIANWFSLLWENVKTIFNNTWEWIKTMLLDYTPHGIIIKYWGSISGWFASLWGNVSNVFSNAWSGIKSFMLGLNPVDWISEIWGNVSAFFDGLAVKFGNWGRSVIDGFVNGIVESANKAIEKVRNVGSEIANGFKSFFGINSPSKLFAEYGINLTQGLAGGIEKGESRVVGVADSLADNTVSGFLPSATVSDGSAIKAAQVVRNAMQSNSVLPSQMVGASGGVSINYSPTVTITGGGSSPEVQQDFLKMLKQHKDEILNIIKKEVDNKIRLSFN